MYAAFDRYIRVLLALPTTSSPVQEHYELLELCRKGDANTAALAVRHV